jgi:hypothetical protein
LIAAIRPFCYADPISDILSSGIINVSRLYLIIGLIGLAISSDRTSCATMIDDFSTGPFSIEVVRYESESITLGALPTSHVLGGSRFVTLNGLGPSPTSSVRVAVDDANRVFRYDADAGATAANFVVRYGHANNLQANLLADGSNAIVFDFVFADFESGRGNFDIIADTEPGGRYLYVPVTNSATPFSLVVPYRAFSASMSGANFANVTSIQFGTGNGNLRGDFSLSAVRTAYFPDGDYNFDGSVDELDYLLWRSHTGNGAPYGSAYPVDPADGNRDGIVDGADYVMWRQNAATISGDAGSIPEPVSISAALIGLIAFANRRNLRSRDRA